MEADITSKVIEAIATGGPVAVIMAFAWYKSEQRANTIFERFVILTEKYATSGEATATALKNIDEKASRILERRS